MKQSQREKSLLVAAGSLPYLLAIYPALSSFWSLRNSALLREILDRFVRTSGLDYCCVFGSVYRRCSTQHSNPMVSCLLLILWTFPVVANNQVSRLASVQTLLPCIRILASAELAYLGFAAHRCGWKTWASIALAASMLLGLLTGVADLVIPRMLKSTKEVFQSGFAFRETYQLSDISENDIVCIGDSFVWGQGASLQETFGKVLEANLRRNNLPGRVFLLGEIGIGPKRYIEIAKGIPRNRRAKRILVAFYHNDMPERDGGVERYINIATVLEDLPR